MSSPKSADTSPSPAPSSVGGSNAPKFGTVIPNRVFVGGISSSTTEQDLLELFSHYGTVKATKVINDRAGVSKGYGFVTFETEDEARRLTQEADNIMLKERKLNIAPAIKKQVTEFGGFMKAYSPRLVEGVTGAGGVVAGNPAATVFFANHTAAAAAAAYYNHQQQQQLLAAAAAANSQGGVQQEYAASGHHALAYASPHHLATQAAYQNQAAAAAQQAAALAAVSNGGSTSSPTQPQYAQPHTASPGSAPTFAYPPTVYYPHYQLHAVQAAQQQQQQQQQLYQQQVAQQNAAAAAAGWPSAAAAAGGGVSAAQWRYFTPQQAYAAAAAAAAAHTQHQPGRATDEQQQQQRSPSHPPLPPRTVEEPPPLTPYLQAVPACPVPGYACHQGTSSLPPLPASSGSPARHCIKHKHHSFLAAGSACSSASSARVSHSAGRPVHSSPRRTVGYSSQNSPRRAPHSEYPIHFSPPKPRSVGHPSRKSHALSHPKHSSPRPSHSASLYSRRHRLDPVTLSPFLPESVGSNSPLEEQRRPSYNFQQRDRVDSSSESSSSSNSSSSSSCSSSDSECSTCARSQSLSLGSYNSCFLSHSASRTREVADADSGDMLSVFSDPSENESFAAYNVNKGPVSNEAAAFQGDLAPSPNSAHLHKAATNSMGAGVQLGEHAGACENPLPHMAAGAAGSDQVKNHLSVFNSLDSCYAEQLSNCSINTSDNNGEARGECASPQPPYSCPRSGVPVWCWPTDGSVPALFWPPTPQYSPYSAAAAAAATQVLLPPPSPHATLTPFNPWLCPCHHPPHYPTTATPHILYSIPPTPASSSTTAPTRSSSVASQSSAGLWRSHSQTSCTLNSGASSSPPSACPPSYYYAVCSPYAQPYHQSPALVFHYPCPAVAAAGPNVENCAGDVECAGSAAADGPHVPNVSLNSSAVSSSHVPRAPPSDIISSNVTPVAHSSSASLQPHVVLTDPGLVPSRPDKHFFADQPFYSGVPRASTIEVNATSAEMLPSVVPALSVGAANTAVTRTLLPSFRESADNRENLNTTTTIAAAAVVVGSPDEIPQESQRDHVKPTTRAPDKNSGPAFPVTTATPVLSPLFPITAVVAAAAAATSVPLLAKPPVVAPVSVSTLPRLQSNGSSAIEKPLPYYYHHLASVPPPVPSTPAAKYSPFR